MAIVFDSATSHAANIATIEVTHSAVGSDRFLLIGIMNNGTVPTSVTYGAQSPTLIASEGRLHLYRLVNPATGAQSATASLAGADMQIIAVVSYRGVDQTTPIGTPQKATNIEQTSIPAPAVSSSATGLVVDVAMMINTAMAAAAGQTERISLDDPGVGFLSFGMSEKSGAASVTMQWDAAATSGDNHIIAVPLIAAAGGGGGASGNANLLLLGVG